MSRLFDRVSDFLAARKGLLPLIGLVFILLNLALQFILPPGWLVSSNPFLHLGLSIAIIGFLLAWAL